MATNFNIISSNKDLMRAFYMHLSSRNDALLAFIGLMEAQGGSVPFTSSGDVITKREREMP